MRVRIQFQIQSLMTKNFKKSTDVKTFNILWIENFSPQKRTSSTLKHENSILFFYICGSFFPSWIRIRIQNADPDPATEINADPDPQPWPVQYLCT